MEMQRTSFGRGVDRLSNLPESILLHILSLLPHSKQVVRTSVLSTRWRFLWISVPVSLEFYFPRCHNEKVISDFLASTHRELFYWRSCEKIRTLTVVWYEEGYVKDVDLLLLFATKVANVEEFNLDIVYGNYQVPGFAYKSTSLRNLEFSRCELNPFGSVNWTSLQSLSIRDTFLADGTVKKVLSGCPNLERFELFYVFGINRLEIASTKLRELILEGNVNESVEVLAPYIQTLKLSGFCFGVWLQQRNVASLITVVLDLTVSDCEDDDEGREEEVTYLKELLHSFAHVQNLELSPWCIECLSILELEGWQCPPSSQKYLKINSALKQLDFPGICNFLRRSVDLETLVIDWYDYERVDLLSFYRNEDEQNRRYEMHNFNFSLLQLKTIKIINFHGPLSGNKFILSLVEYFLKNAIVLEKFVIVAKIEGSDTSRDYVKMEQEFLSFPRSSPRASVVFSY